MRQLERANTGVIAGVHEAHRSDARNLVHYLALRDRDVRGLQRELGERGLSSLGRCEPHVMATVHSVRAAIDGTASRFEPALGFEQGRAALDHNADALFGPRPRGRVPRIMVTLPGEAAGDYDLVAHLLAQGMDVARINGAHDGPDAWKQMVTNVRRATAEVGRPCRVSMDLPGPKLRTGELVPGPEVVKLRPGRDLRGVAIQPASVALVAVASTSGDVGAVLPVDPAWIDRRHGGDVIDLVDTRGARRELRVVDVAAGVCAAEVWDTTYVETGSALSCGDDATLVGPLRPIPQSHLLRVGDPLVLTRDLRPSVPWRRGQPGCARIGCSLPAAFDAARVGQRAILDDGKLTAVIERVTTEEIGLRILTASPNGSALRAEKGINLPDTELPVAAVTEADLPLLEIAAAHADMVALSFLRNEHDVDDVREHLARLGADHLGLILKIETTAAFTRLPEILLHAMRSPRVGVMIARGDLAVECGYERLAELQEEILWLCEAAHLPVIWATEVLDQLARTGQPSRAEITDAAMSQRAECVMLNKGPHVDVAITVLDDILRRMSGHQRKKTALLRPLRSWTVTA